jgi:WD40 repeat protein
MRQHRIEMNWRVKPIRPPKVLKGHDDHVITCLQFYGSRIVSGSDDNTLKVWSATTGKVNFLILLSIKQLLTLTVIPNVISIV